MRLSILLLCAAPAVCGDLSSRLELAMNRILHGDSPRYDENFVIADAIPLDARRFTNFSGDLSGRYIEALSIAAAAGTKSAALDRTVASGLALAPFSIPVAHFRLAYSPGGYPMQPAQAILRPLAEATSSPDQDQWAFWLPTAK